MKAMTAYSIKADATLALRAFSSKRAAARYGNGQHIFASVDELANSRLTSEDARKVFFAVTGKAINVSERQKLSELLFDAISGANLPTTDKEADMVILCSQQPEKAPAPPAKEQKIMSEQVDEHIESAEKKERKFSRSPRSGTKNPIEAFGVHVDSNRAKALLKMEKKLGQQIPAEELVIAVYGSNEKRNVASFGMVIKGLFAIQDGNELDLEIRKEKSEKGISYGLYAK